MKSDAKEQNGILPPSSVVVRYSHKEYPGDVKPKVTKIYDGIKAFWRHDISVRFIIFQHKIDTKNDEKIDPCIEVVSYIIQEGKQESVYKEEAPRLFLSCHKIYNKLNKSDLNLGRTVVSERSQRAMIMIAKFIFTRIGM